MSAKKTKNEVLDLGLELISAIAKLQDGDGTQQTQQTQQTPKRAAVKRSTSGSRIQAVLIRLTRQSVPEIVQTIAAATGRSPSNARSLLQYDSVTLETLCVLADALGIQVGRLANALAAEIDQHPLPGWKRQKRQGVTRADLAW